MSRVQAVLALWLALWLALAPAALAAEPFARVSIEDDGRIVPGQQVHVTVDVFAPNFFTSPPQFPLFDLKDALVTLPDARAQNLVQTIDGTQYSGIRRVYAVVPETSGTFTLPPIVIELGYSEDGKTIKGEARLPPSSFTVAAAKDEAGAIAFAARGLTLTQSFDRDPSKLKVGEALVRTITVFGQDTQAMMIPAVPLEQPQGFKIYEKPPQLDDNAQSAEGTAGSSRTQTITYVPLTVGKSEIPAVSYPWFDLDAHAASTAALPATVVAVADAPPVVQAISPQLDDEGNAEPGPSWSATSIAATLAATFALAAFCWFGWRLVPGALRRVTRWREIRRGSERQQFKQLLSSIRNDDPSAVYHHLGSWVHAAGHRSIGDWVSSTKDETVARAVGGLERELFGSPSDDSQLDRASLLQAISTARVAGKRSEKHRRNQSLVELNPSSA